MEAILESIAEAPISASSKRRAYHLLIKIAYNIIQAANSDDPNLGKYKWVKAHSGSALRENVISVSPLFRELLEALGFTFRVGRPPHVRTGDSQEYVVFRDDADIEDLASKAQILEAVLGSLSDEDASSSQPHLLATRPPAASEALPNERNEPATCPTACSTDSRPQRSAAQRSCDPDAALLELRREQQERYRQRAAGGGSSASRSNETSGSGTDESGGSWFWRKFSWGGSNDSNNDDSNSQGRSTSSRRRPQLNNRMMTLRDLPKPQRRG